jgi:hypothetical protein
MKRSNFAIFAVILLVFANGCSSSSSSNPTPPQVTYVTGGTYVYYAQNLNATTGQAIAGSGDTITSVVVETGIPYQGMANVTAIQNTHSNPGSGIASVDTTYIAQSNGDYYHYNYGLELLNSNKQVLAEGNSGNPIVAGWVLQAELSETSANTWVAMDTILNLTIGTAQITDTAKESSDTTFQLFPPNEQTSTPISARHSVHSIYLTSVAVNANMSVDTYVSATDGPVLDIFHQSTIAGNPFPGRITVLLGTK